MRRIKTQTEDDIPIVEPWPEWIGDKLALTPPMGWNSFYGFGQNVSEQMIRETADVMVAQGLKDVGYEYIGIDDLWQGGRDEKGFLYPDPERFPSGIKALSDYVHSKGFKFGIYSDAGIKTCCGKVGSYLYEEKDASTFASWGVDLLKYDYCFAPNDYEEATRRYTQMGNALKATGRDILYSVCEWGVRSPWLWARKAGGHMWRVSFDVGDCWDSPRNVASPIGILTAIDAMADLEQFSGPGGWNDPDMLVVGLKGTGFIGGPGCAEIEYQTQMSMWCMLHAPLIIGCDVRNMSESTKRILTNKEIIAIDQDVLGRQGYRVHRKNGLETWKKPLSNNHIAIALLNRSEVAVNASVEWQALELSQHKEYVMRNVWRHEDIDILSPRFSQTVLPHECKVFVLTPKE